MTIPRSQFGGQSFQVRQLSPAEAEALVAQGAAVLVDVREADEWSETGVAAPATTLAMSALSESSEDWVTYLEANQDKEILLYCKAGGRSQRVAQALASLGYKTGNVGGFSDWLKAGLPVRPV